MEKKERIANFEFMNNIHFSRKERQLKNHILKLDILLKKSSGLFSNEIKSLVHKIKELISQLSSLLSSKRILSIVGSFAILFGLSNNNKINAQSFNSPTYNPFGLTLNSSIVGSNYYTGKAQFVDIDNDGDYDMFYETLEVDTSYYSYYQDNIFIYHENIGSITNPQFSVGIKNPFNLTSPQNFTLGTSILSHNLVDLDGDGDYDILATYSGLYESYNYQTYTYSYSTNTKFKYYENIGNPTMPLFSTQQNNPFGLDIDSIIAISDVVDIDGDGDYDIICSSSSFGNQGYIQNQDMIFLENIGTPSIPQFSAAQPNQIGISFPTSSYPVIPSFGDIDMDGDYDLLTTPYKDYSNTEYDFLYQQNKGSATNPVMSLQAQNPFGLSPDTSYVGILVNSEMIDLDGDGDQDIITSGFYGNNFLYFEYGSSSTDINEVLESIKIYPIPTTNNLNIGSNIKFDKIEVIDQQGKYYYFDNIDKPLNLNKLNKGIYMINLYHKETVYSKKFTKL